MYALTLPTFLELPRPDWRLGYRYYKAIRVAAEATDPAADGEVGEATASDDGHVGDNDNNAAGEAPSQQDPDELNKASFASELL